MLSQDMNASYGKTILIHVNTGTSEIYTSGNRNPVRSHLPRIAAVVTRCDGTSHRIGPDWWGVLGRKVASADGYADYSASMRAYGGTWTEERFENFIKNPQAAVHGTAMEFGGVEDENSRVKIVDFLKHAPKVISK